MVSFRGRLAQAVQVAMAIRVFKEAGLAVVPALDNVLGNAGKIESRLASHSGALDSRSR